MPALRPLAPQPLRPPDGAYVGYRWPGASSVLRLPCGEYAVLGRDGDPERRLARRILLDRLRRRPGAALLDAFLRDWVHPSPRGEFVWPVEAIDEWLDAALTTGDASPRVGGQLAPAHRRDTHDPLVQRLAVMNAPSTTGAL